MTAATPHFPSAAPTCRPSCACGRNARTLPETNHGSDLMCSRIPAQAYPPPPRRPTPPPRPAPPTRAPTKIATANATSNMDPNNRATGSVLVICSLFCFAAAIPLDWEGTHFVVGRIGFATTVGAGFMTLAWSYLSNSKRSPNASSRGPATGGQSADQGQDAPRRPN